MSIYQRIFLSSYIEINSVVRCLHAGFLERAIRGDTFMTHNNTFSTYM